VTLTKEMLAYEVIKGLTLEEYLEAIQSDPARLIRWGLLYRANGRSPRERKPPAGACPECGSDVYMEEGCRKCHSCGWSACS
jgi:hypothetical protein